MSDWSKTQRSYDRIREKIRLFEHYPSYVESPVRNSLFRTVDVLYHYPYDYMRCWEFVELADVFAAGEDLDNRHTT